MCVPSVDVLGMQGLPAAAGGRQREEGLLVPGWWDLIAVSTCSAACLHPLVLKEEKKTLTLAFFIPAVPNLFVTRDWCSYENLMPNDLRWD